MEITFDTRISNRDEDIFLNKSESINRVLTAASEDQNNGFAVNEIVKTVYEISPGRGFDLPLDEPGKSLTFLHLQLTDTNFQTLSKNAVRFRLLTGAGGTLFSGSQLTLLNVSELSPGMSIHLAADTLATPAPGVPAPRYNLLVMLGYKPTPAH